MTTPSEPTGWGAGRDWTWRSTPTPGNRSGITSQGFPMSEADARQWVADRAENDDWIYSVVYRDTTAWTEEPQ